MDAPRGFGGIQTIGRDQAMTSAASVTASTVPNQGTGAGSTPSAALHDIQVQPVPMAAARQMVERHHYLHSLPGGTYLAFGGFAGSRLLGVLTLGAGPFNAASLVDGAKAGDCLTLTRLWLSDCLPPNSESRVIGIVVRSLRKNTNIRFVLSYADPAHGHVGTIYQACGWLYTGLSEAMPLYDLGDGIAHHSRSLAHCFGTHSLRHFADHGVGIKLIPQLPKHRYIRFLDDSWRCRLRAPVLPYPKKGQIDGTD